MLKHAFYIRNIGKLGIYYRIILVLLLFMHILIVDSIIVILFCTMFQGVKGQTAKKNKKMRVHLDTIVAQRTYNYYPCFEKNIYCLKIQDRIINKIMLR